MATRLNPYLVLDGNAREAVAFYQKALEAQLIGIQAFGDMPPNPDQPLPPGVSDRVMHAQLKVGDTDLMFSDTFPGMPYQVGSNVTIAIITDDAATARRYFEALADGGRVDMPIQETHWSPAYGQLVDRYGVVWQISTEKKA
ncbi:MAG: VOC family protein [Bacillota bacterium]